MGASITTQDAVVINLVGQLKVKDEQGNIRNVTIGDIIHAGEQLIFTPKVQFNLEYEDGSSATQASLSPSEIEQHAANGNGDMPSMPTPESAATPQAEVDAEIAALQAQILAGEDPTEGLPETAAGIGLANQGDSYFVALGRVGDETLAGSGWDTSGVSPLAAATPDTTLPVEPLPVFAAPSVSSASFSIFEANLPQGSDPSALLTQLASNIQANAEAGIATLTINGTDIISNGQFNGPIVVNTPNGVLTINGFDSTTGQFIYDYALGSSVDHSANDQLQLVFNIELTDNEGNTASGSITVNIIDDQPTGVADANSLGEDQTAQVAGNLLDNDTLGADNASIASVTNNQGDASTINGTTSIQGEFGVLTLTSDGNYTYQLNSTSTAVQALAEGDQITETFNYLLTDTDGDSVLVPLTITITGSNDAPVITPPTSGEPTDGYDAGTVIEAGNLDDGTLVPGTPQISGTLVATDIDTAAALTWSVNGASNFGSFSIDPATGEWTYNLDNSLADSLAEGTSVTETFLVTVSDEFGATDTREVVITIEGTNDSPIITSSQADATGAVTEYQEDSDTQSGPQTASGTLTATDVDTGAVLTWSGDAEGTYGDFAIDPTTGEWTYNLDNAASNSLAEGEQVVEQFLVTVTDEFGAIDTQMVTITITGTNDGPVITPPPGDTPTDGYDAGTVVEAGNLDDGTVVQGTPQVSGTLAATDIDNGAVLTWSGNAAGIYGSFSIDPATGEWTYNLDNSLADSLAEGTSVTETFLVTVTDEFGGTDTREVIITIEGTNDSPIITSSQADATGAVTEYQEDSEIQSGPQTTGGTLTAGDVDTGAILTWSGDAEGTYGDFAIDPSTGEWTYNLDNAASNSLAEGEQVVEQFLVTVTDEFGATDTQMVTVTITGTNDAPVITPPPGDTPTDGYDAGTVVEAGNLDDGTVVPGTPQVSGTLAATDVDNGAVLTWSGDDEGTYGGFAIDPTTGGWTYDLNNGTADSLAEGQSATEKFVVTVTDEFGATDTIVVTINIQGTNDSPIISLENGDSNSGNVVEAGNLDDGTVVPGTPQVSGTLTVSDVDTIIANNPVWSFADDLSNTTNYGSFDIDPATGAWTYDLNNGTADSLAEGQSATEKFVVTVTDEFGATDTIVVTINIQGTNDSPIISLENGDSASGSVTEDIDVNDGKISDSGTLTVNDVDNIVNNQPTLSAAHDGNDITWHQSDNTDVVVDGFSDLATTLKAGFSVDNNGNWLYEIDNDLIQFLDVNETITLSFDVTVTDEFGATDTETVTITINGQEDLIQGEFSKEIWVPADPAQLADPYALGYPLNIPIPIDVDATDEMTITALILENTNAASSPNDVELGQIWYMPDGSNSALEYDFFNPVELSASELSTLVYVPGDNTDAIDQVDVSLTFTINSGGQSVDGVFIIHSVPANSSDINTVIIGGGKSPLTSGNDQDALLTVSDTLAEAINTNASAGTLDIFTDFQETPFDKPIPIDEREDAIADYYDTVNPTVGDRRETEVSVSLTINGIIFIVLAADNGVDDWHYDSDSELMKASIDYSNIWSADPNDSSVIDPNNPINLAQYLSDHSVDAGDQWTITYYDNNGGNWQARFVQAEFTHELLPDNAITVTGTDDINNLIFGTTEGDSLTGANLNDDIYGREGDDMIFGLDGDDVLLGGSGNDTIDGGAGNDTILGGIGDDTIDGGTGNDILYGGQGSDLIDAGIDNDADTIVWEAGSADGSTDLVYNFEDGVDSLNISEILTGVGAGSTDATTLDAYLDFEFTDYDNDGNTDTVITIHANGGLEESLTIVLSDVDLSGQGSDSTVIQHLLDNHTLITENIP
ncbi:retention module-containing protein [Shewanella sp. Isolate11]|uniref:retention module-containing protein n=1 Tax=Shewanella sp. Isolate11 TaxID=2908530 RepID=UPI001EFD9F0A|nr:retention module-containing protein [Shewanella sp. Isolate11]MCG9695422.1 retention module-containing protein [Shewanella sp. Isolate11]